MIQLLRAAAAVFTAAGLIALAANESQANPTQTPGASVRPSTSNFKDMVLAVCISRYQQGQAAADAASSANALVEWTRYDAESSPDEINRMVDRFLGRQYRNPLGEQGGPVAEFNLLKCLDLYHSRELDALTKRVVLPDIRPNRQNR